MNFLEAVGYFDVLRSGSDRRQTGALSVDLVEFMSRIAAILHGGIIRRAEFGGGISR